MSMLQQVRAAFVNKFIYVFIHTVPVRFFVCLALPA
jgi:hypothetical protein